MNTNEHGFLIRANSLGRSVEFAQSGEEPRSAGQDLEISDESAASFSSPSPWGCSSPNNSPATDKPHPEGMCEFADNGQPWGEGGGIGKTIERTQNYLAPHHVERRSVRGTLLSFVSIRVHSWFNRF
ncbi:MAG: hypothetical protein CMO80_20925 [Verrucomicrobiales bacterium]|nr:hypothetical protein [Verrucomicrobiales bacterium]